jgi:hypothetical protein
MFNSTFEIFDKIGVRGNELVILLHRSTTTSSLDVSSSGGSCPTSPSIQHRGMKHSGSESNVWSRLASSSHDSSADKG